MPRTSRRGFLQSTSLVETGYFVAAGTRRAWSKSGIERLHVACIGVGGKGGSDSDNAALFGDVIAICDVDRNAFEKKSSSEKYKHGGRFTDYRELLALHGTNIDIVTISTPDHMHAPVTLDAMRRGISCYTKKPLTRTIYDARLLAKVAAEMAGKGVCTQTGKQGTALDSSREEIAKALERLDCTNFLGVAPEREFWPGLYHSFQHRGWWDVGTGALGDMACHQWTVPFVACELRDPVSVVARTTGHDFDSFPASSIIEFRFPSTATRPAIPFWWYDRRGKKPPAEVFAKWGIDKVSDSGVLMVGRKGRPMALRQATAERGGSRGATAGTDRAGCGPIVEVPRCFLSTLKAGFVLSAQTGLETAFRGPSAP